MIGQPDNHCSFSLFCGYSDKKKTPYLWVLSCLYLILFKNRPIVPDATLDQVDPLVYKRTDPLDPLPLANATFALKNRH